MKLFALFLLAVPFVAAAQSTKISEMPYAGAPCTADGGIGPSPQQVSTFRHFDASLRNALQRNDTASLAFLVKFPLTANTSKGTLLIPDAESLAGHYDDIFPTRLREQILTTAANDYICKYDQGLGYKTGSIWVSTDGHKFSLNTVNVEVVQSPTKSGPQLRYTCETKTHRIVIDDLNNGSYRYRSWNKPKETDTTPDVDIKTGAEHWEGTGICAYPTYSFTRENVQYDISQGLGCTDGSEPKESTGRLSVTISGRQVTDGWCY